ncbi:MAG TPA: hypothetical protein VHM19_00120 [Polyangiales bacterium]|jgi:hypothetical protein|nr:hypothetical protein [Polyangiales bacterium]
MERPICASIRELRRLRFVYAGCERVVEPYCHGTTAPGNEVLRAVQVGGDTRGGRRSYGFGKLWVVAKMESVALTDERFEPNDPDYNPNDSAMARIHCRVEKRR